MLATETKARNLKRKSAQAPQPSQGTDEAALAIVEAMFDASPRARANVKQPSRLDVLMLLSILDDEKYAKDSREVGNHPAYFKCLNAGLLKLRTDGEGTVWHDGSPYRKHAITPKGNKVRRLLRAEFPICGPEPAPVIRDRYNAEWLDALEAQAMREMDSDRAAEREAQRGGLY